MVHVKANYSSSFRGDLNCSFCEKEGKLKKDTQKHMMKCPIIKKKCVAKKMLNMEI